MLSWPSQSKLAARVHTALGAGRHTLAADADVLLGSSWTPWLVRGRVLAVCSAYERRDAVDGNGTRGSERKALRAGAELVPQHGRHAPDVRTLGLLGAAAGDQQRLSAEGDDVIDLAPRSAVA